MEDYTSFIDYARDWEADFIKYLPYFNRVDSLAITEQSLSVYMVPINPPEELLLVGATEPFRKD